MTKDIENPIIFDKHREINDYIEPKIIGKCNICENYISNTDEYLRTANGEVLCDTFCFEKFGIKNGLIEIINK